MYRDKVKITELEPGLGSFEFNSFDKPSPSFKNIELAKLKPEFSSIRLIKLQRAELEPDQYFVEPS